MDTPIGSPMVHKGDIHISPHWNFPSSRQEHLNDLHQHDEPETEEERILGSLWIISDRGPARGEKKQVQTLWESHVAMDAYNQMYIYISVPVHTYIYIYT